jgi:hypothetical protein
VRAARVADGRFDLEILDRAQHDTLRIDERKRDADQVASEPRGDRRR